MKKLSWAAALLLAAVLTSVTGCADQSGNVHHPLLPGEQPGPTVVHQAPPPAPPEVVVPAPGPEYAYAWNPGCWTWQGSWVWLKGSWIPLPCPRAVWVPGLWAKRGHHYIWIRGHWK
jgi:hypothetical protein